MSSAEAELIALVKCTAECMGVQSMYRDRGTNLKCDLYADSSAALAIAKRKGAGKLRHIHVSALWIQDIQYREGATYMKVLGSENPADLMTKYLTGDKADNAIDKMSQVVQEGRASSSLDIQGKADYLRESYGIGHVRETAPRSVTAGGGARASPAGPDKGERKKEQVARFQSQPRRERFATTTSESTTLP